MSATHPRLFVALLLCTGSSALADTHYVSVNSTNPVPPYINWATAANVIQDAVDAATAGGTVLVTNGVYVTGGRALHGAMTNRVAVDKPLTLKSVNGPEFTIIRGYQVPNTTNGNGATRCVYLTNGASLSGFTLTRGATIASIIDLQYRGVAGGGVYCEPNQTRVTNCRLTGNAAHLFGGGAYQGTFDNCVISSNRVGLFGLGGGVNGGVGTTTLNACALVGNSSANGGGGVFNCRLTDCTLAYNSTHAGSSGPSDGGGGAFAGGMTNCLFVGNTSTTSGGGARECFLDSCTLVGNGADGMGGATIYSWLNNCIVYYNNGANHSDQSVGYSCISESVGGTGNITNAPRFVDTNGWANLRLQSNSPCINAGNNAYVKTTNDLDGSLRIAGGTVDMGAYEFQNPSSAISYAWLQQYGLPIEGSVDDIDGDGDQATTWEEWKMRTIPTNALSVLKMLHADMKANGTEVSWQSVADHRYTLERATNGTVSFTVLQGSIAGQAGTTSFTDTTATNGDAFLYRVSVPE